MEPPSWDPVRGWLRLSPRHLGVLAETVGETGAGAEGPAARELTAAGLLHEDGLLPAGLHAVAMAAAGARAQVAVTRLSRMGEVRVGITWGPSGVVVMRAVGADEVGDIVVQPPSQLARTVWRVLQLGPRPCPPDREAVEVDASSLLAPFTQGAATWTELLHVDRAVLVLDRLDSVADQLRPPVTWAILDARARGLWQVTGPRSVGAFVLAPTSPVAAFAAISALQPVPEVT